jgi:hypothetical protein
MIFGAQSPWAAVVAAALGLVVLLWKGYQLRGSYGQARTWLLLGSIASLTAMLSLGRLLGAAATTGTAGEAAAIAVAKSLTLAYHFFLFGFFLYASGSRRRLRIELIVFAVVIVALVVLTGLGGFAPLPDLSKAGVPARLLNWDIGLYVSYTDAGTVLAAWACARMSRGPLAVGLRIIAVAMVVALLTSTVIGPIGTQLSYLGHPLPAPVHRIGVLWLNLSTVLLLLGVVYPGVVGRAGRAWHNRRAYRELEPLWTALHQAFPETMLRPAGESTVADRLVWRSVDRRHYRRVMEIRDGLTLLSPWLSEADVDHRPDRVAEWIRAALGARLTGAEPTGRPFVVAAPSTPGFDSESAELVALSRAFRPPAAG